MIIAAIEVFKKRGYVAASTRELAAGAGVKAPALQYYFGNKRGVYLACIETVIAAIRERIDPLLKEAQRSITASSGVRDLITAYCRLQDGIIDSCFSEGEGAVVSSLLAWEQNDHEVSEAKELLRDQVDLPIFSIACDLVSRISGEPADSLSVGLRTFALFGSYGYFYSDTRRVYNALAWSPHDPGSLDRLKPILREQTTWVLQNLAKSQAKPRAADPGIKDAGSNPASSEAATRKRRGNQFAA